jgi:hypothetical protein
MLAEWRCFHSDLSGFEGALYSKSFYISSSTAIGCKNKAKQVTLHPEIGQFSTCHPNIHGFMSNIFTSSIGKKLMMSLAGLFLIVFLLVHLGINLMLIFSGSRKPSIKRLFQSNNVVVKIMELVCWRFPAACSIKCQMQNGLPTIPL